LAIFVSGSVGVFLLAVALVWAAVRSRLQRCAVARIVSDLGEVPAPGSLESALARAVGAPELRIACLLPGSERFVDASGSMVAEPTTQPGRLLTTFTHENRRIIERSPAACTSPSAQSRRTSRRYFRSSTCPSHPTSIVVYSLCSHSFAAEFLRVLCGRLPFEGGNEE
jgi:hypothetical protein